MKFENIPFGGIAYPKGFKAAGVHCGLKAEGLDLMLVAAEKPCSVAAVYTKNAVKGAPLTVTAKNILHGRAQAMVCNSGNANCCVEGGTAAAKKMCGQVAKALHIPAEDVIVASTGEMGIPLPLDRVTKGIDDAASRLSKEGGRDAALAILSEDSVPKQHAMEFLAGGTPCRIGGMAKGSGLLHPSMATMLCFLTTDVNIHPELLDRALKEAIDVSFHRIALGNTPSPNDMVTILSSGLSGNPKITDFGEDYRAFCHALCLVCLELAKQVAKDSIPNGRLLTCHVQNARTQKDARAAAKAVTASPQVTAALSNGRAGWTDVVCAIGGSGANVDGNNMDVSLMSSDTGEIVALCDRCVALPFRSQKAVQMLKEQQVIVLVNLHDGSFEGEAYGCLAPFAGA